MALPSHDLTVWDYIRLLPEVTTTNVLKGHEIVDPLSAKEPFYLCHQSCQSDCAVVCLEHIQTNMTR